MNQFIRQRVNRSSIALCRLRSITKLSSTFPRPCLHSPIATCTLDQRSFNLPIVGRNVRLKSTSTTERRGSRGRKSFSRLLEPFRGEFCWLWKGDCYTFPFYKESNLSRKKSDKLEPEVLHFYIFYIQY